MSLFCFISKYLKMISRVCLIWATLLPCFAHGDDEKLSTQLQTQAEQYVFSQLVVDPTSQAEITAATIDSRRILHPCQDHITPSLAGNGEIKRNTTVKLSCDLTPNWDIYVPVRVRILKPFVTVSEAVTKNTVLTASMLKVDFMDEVMMRGDSFTDPNMLIGSRSKRDLKPGQPLRQNQICVVCRDDVVTIEANTAGIAISTAGKALQDGSFGDTIRVQNLRSQRTISVNVVAVGRVQVKL